ncbi:MAG: Nif11-like leader peptide family RiPP precursor [Deltaproteobacteria bacterium]|nr:Nif11-like leader peptide family RiPP precursor [Deltaproteobacteria bacterium]
MSQENVKGFLKNMAQDEKLRAEFEKADKDEIIILAEKAGIPFSLDELKAVIEASPMTVSEELSDDDLEKVAGGAFGLPSPPVSLPLETVQKAAEVAGVAGDLIPSVNINNTFNTDITINIG